MNNTKKEKKYQDTWIQIAFKSDISHELGNTLPYPQKHFILNNRVVYCYLLAGFFETKKSIEYLNDIIARFKISFDCDLIKKQTVDKSNIKALQLQQFQNLKSLAIQKINTTTKYDSSRDFIFWCLKLHCELICRNRIFSYSELLDYATDNFIDQAKDYSTLKAKCRNIFNWYLDRDFKPSMYIKKDKGEVMATRKEQAIKMHTKLAKDTKKKVLSVVTGMFAHEYKKKNGKWNVSKIAKDSGTSRDTVYKYLKEL